jgi:hypothetical protein
MALMLSACYCCDSCRAGSTFLRIFSALYAQPRSPGSCTHHSLVVFGQCSVVGGVGIRVCGAVGR